MIADSLANAPAFVPSQDALLQGLGVLCDELTANNQQSLGVRRSPFIVPDPVAVDIARDVALQICAGLRKYFAQKVDHDWHHICLGHFVRGRAEGFALPGQLAWR